MFEKKDDGVSKPPLERSYKSKILNHFPANLPWNPFDEDAVTQVNKHIYMISKLFLNIFSFCSCVCQKV